jgi:hypothetical protein
MDLATSWKVEFFDRGFHPLFEDPQTSWAIERIGGVQGKTVLELGPLEGWHSCILENAGVRSVVAIEGNTN